MNIWTCKIGETSSLPHGADLLMRQAIAKAYRELTGQEPDFLFSGWGGTLTEAERAVVEDALPACDWCHRPAATHTADEHPLPKSHPDYNAFYDATDAELTGVLLDALRNPTAMP